MRQVENDCVDCGLPCIGTSCRYYKAVHFYCDDCGDEDTLYEFDGEELCIRCIAKRLRKVRTDD